MGCVQHQQAREANQKNDQKTIRNQGTPESKKQKIAERTASEPAKSTDNFKLNLRNIE